ncbi:hypothetical protein GCM10010353_70470 [Streptomyces chryseus]|nr:hypothetical protein GCM10010353_70470 [Streptomyces chryseus]
MQEGLLGAGALPDLRAIDSLLHEMSGTLNADRWAPAALSTDAGWAQVRQLARRVLTVELGDETPAPLPLIKVVR